MQTVKLPALLLSALSLSGAPPEPPTKQLVLQWTTVDNRSSSPLYRINSLWCEQAYCRLEIIYVFACDARSTIWHSAISSSTYRTDDWGSQLQVTRTGETVSVQVGRGCCGTREQLTYRITDEGTTPTGEVQSGQDIKYEGHFVDGSGTQQLESLKCESVPFVLLARGCGNVSIPCPVIGAALEQD